MALKWLCVHPAKDGFTRSVREFHLPVSALKNGSGAALIVLKIEQLYIINPRRACAARVTVLGLCVCVSVCLSVCPLPRFLPPRATMRPTRYTSGFSGT